MKIGGSRRIAPRFVMVPATEFVIPAIESMPRTPIRGGNPGVVYGLQMTRKHLHQSAPRFSYLRVPATAGMSDWYENSQLPSIPRPTSSSL